jgi:hypothetical protein
MTYAVKKTDAEQRRRIEEFHYGKLKKTRKAQQTAAAERHRDETAKQEADRMRRLNSIRPVAYEDVDRQ